MVISGKLAWSCTSQCVVLLVLYFLQASEQYLTSDQFLAHDLRQVISRPQT